MQDGTSGQGVGSDTGHVSAPGTEGAQGARLRRLAYERVLRARKLADDAGITLDEALAVILERAKKRREALVSTRHVVGKRVFGEDARERKRREVREQSARRRARRKLDPVWVKREAERRSKIVQVLSPAQLARKLDLQRARRGTPTADNLGRPSGSVLATAAPSSWRDVLSEIGRLVPYLDEREDIIAEAALLAVQGMALAEAVAQAKRTVSRDATPYRYMKPIEDCFWL